MNWANKIAVTVEKEDVVPPPTEGEPIQPPIFPDITPKVDVPVKPKPKKQKPSVKPDLIQEEGFAPAIAEAVKESLSVLKNIVSEELKLIGNNQFETDEIQKKLNDVVETLSDVDSIVLDLRKRRVPEKKQYESDQSYEDSLYNQIIQIIDSVVCQVNSVFPEYQYNKSSITRFDPVGNILNGEFLIAVVLSNFQSKIRYHLEIPVYIFDGYVQFPEVFRHNGETFKFDVDVIDNIVSYIPSQDSDLSMGAHWHDQSKNPLSQAKSKIPNAPYSNQKEYRRFDQRLNPVKPKTQFWNNYGIADFNKDVNGISSPTVQYNEIDYALR